MFLRVFHRIQCQSKPFLLAPSTPPFRPFSLVSISCTMVSQTVHWLLLLAKTKFKSRLLKVIILLGGLLRRKVGTLGTFPLMKNYRFDTDGWKNIEAKHWKNVFDTLVLGLPTAIIFVCTALSSSMMTFSSIISPQQNDLHSYTIPCAIEKTVSTFLLLPFFSFLPKYYYSWSVRSKPVP